MRSSHQLRAMSTSIRAGNVVHFYYNKTLSAHIGKVVRLDGDVAIILWKNPAYNPGKRDPHARKVRHNIESTVPLSDVRSHFRGSLNPKLVLH